MSNYFEIIPMKKFRNTDKVKFYNIPLPEKISAMDLVLHDSEAQSPGKTGDVLMPWYYHPHQKDNLFVAFGKRRVELFVIGEKQIRTFEVTPSTIFELQIEKNGNIKDRKILCNEPAILSWDFKVFHRVTTGKEGSASVNIAVQSLEFDIKTNFNIYSLNIETNEYSVIREGHQDQL